MGVPSTSLTAGSWLVPLLNWKRTVSSTATTPSDGAPRTGQADHRVNRQCGLEADDPLSQQTILVTYASDRVVSRGLNGTPPQPDVIESPGLRIDLVMREGFKLLGQTLEGKLEVRNILGRKREEFQRAGDNRIEVNSYDVGTTVALSLSAEF